MANQDKFPLTKFSFHIEFHKELSFKYYILWESIVLKSCVRRLCKCIIVYY